MTEATDLEQRLDRVESRFAMHDLVSDYCHGFDKRDWARFSAIWWPDAVWDIGPPFGKFEGSEGIANRGARKARVVRHAGSPLGGPAQGGDEFARQAEGQIKAAHPVAGLGHAGQPAIERLEALHAVEDDAVAVGAAHGQGDGFAAARCAGEIAAQQGPRR